MDKKKTLIKFKRNKKNKQWNKLFFDAFFLYSINNALFKCRYKYFTMSVIRLQGVE